MAAKALFELMNRTAGWQEQGAEEEEGGGGSSSSKAAGSEMRGGSEGTGGVSVYAAAQLAAVPISLKPLSLYDAYDQPRASHVPEAARTGRWDLLEDRPGKPGWIATRAGATMDFRVRFGAIPFLTVAFLRSYAGMCNASLRMNEAAFPGSVRLVGEARVDHAGAMVPRRLPRPAGHGQVVGL